ncbi:uncharacterized protein LOC114712218 [Neltuma alba]|uniref:uncharacterized protein LOC114712218 n=1 Tax=Neltuma alba TaxID=207710 RepID=UPI0010A36F89|nr:uncharacterized protein LOC114712218 [Prosopis alba]
MEGRRNFNDIVAEPLTEDSSEDCFEWVKNYLISDDLWELTNSSVRPDENQVEDFAKWRRNNAAALHVIRISCGHPNHSHIRGVSEAKVAWILSIIPTILLRHALLPQIKELGISILYKAIAQNKWSAAKESIVRHPEVLDVDFATSMGETPVHVAAKFGHLGIVEELVRLVLEEYLEIRDAYYNNTPLAIAVSHSELIPVAACLINKNKKALAIPSEDWQIPVTVAFDSGHKEMGRYLYSVTPLEVFKPKNRTVGPAFLANYIALHLLQRCTELLFATDLDEEPTIQNIALYLPNTLKKRMREIYKMKVQHPQAAEILNLVCEDMIYLNKVKKNMVGKAMIAAAKAENVEFCLRVTKANPELITLVTFGYPDLPFFFDAVKYRRSEIFNLLHGFRFKNVAVTLVDHENLNNLLHVAAMLSPSSYLNCIPGTAL